MKRALGGLGIAVVAALVFIAFAGYRGREIVLNGAGLVATHHLTLVGELRRPEDIRVGSTTELRFTLRNDGPTTPRWVRLRISSGFNEGFELDELRPAGRSVVRTGVRIIDWHGVEPGDTETFTAKLIGKAAGEYAYVVEILTDNTRVHEISGHSVVFP